MSCVIIHLSPRCHENIIKSESPAAVVSATNTLRLNQASFDNVLSIARNWEETPGVHFYCVVVTQLLVVVSIGVFQEYSNDMSS